MLCAVGKAALFALEDVVRQRVDRYLNVSLSKQLQLDYGIPSNFHLELGSNLRRVEDAGREEDGGAVVHNRLSIRQQPERIIESCTKKLS